MAYFRCTGSVRQTISLTLTLNGAKGDNIAIYDKSFYIIGSAIFDANATSKEITIDIIPNETYTFMSSIAKALDGSTLNFSKSVVLNKNTSVVNVMPDRALYWYGNTAESGSFTRVVVGSGSTFTENVNSLTFTVTAGNGIRVTSNNNPSYSGTSKMKALATSNLYTEAYIEIVKPTSWGSDRYHKAGNIVNGLSEFEIDEYNSNYYLDFNIGQNSSTTVHAVWLE